ncbi:hypothetical protein HYU14_05520 [Candidatus Woesearchaeota archaeon]|nr:hypothetical protein [Candidatus Woesearchaeota archaeon]
MTAKGLAIQAHNYLNPSAFARNAVYFRTRDGINNLGLSSGQKIGFWSDGMEYKIMAVDRDPEIMKGVKDILNS